MPDTVSNHDKHIATSGSSHVATAMPATDHCLDACGQPTVFGENQINTEHLGTGQTTKTTIYDDPIWTEGGWLDAAPSEPAHAGVGGGVTQNIGPNGQLNYTNLAYPDEWSEDVKAEGKGVVRTDDATKQNGGNCDGFTDGSNLADDVDTEAEYLKKKCVIVSVTGKCAHGRELGAPPNADKGADGYYLDILAQEDEQVDIEVERKDLTTNSAPACGKHTDWVARRKGQGEGDGVEHKEVTDHLILKGDIVKNPMSPSMFNIGGVKISGGFGDTGGRGEQMYRREQRGNLSKNMARATARGETSARRTTARRSQNNREEFWTEKSTYSQEGKPGWMDGISAGVDMVKLLAALRTHWKYEQNPPVINVTGTACGGAKNVKLRVFPPDEVQYKVPKDWLEEKLSLLMNLGRTIEWCGNKFKLKWGSQYKWELCGGFELGFKLAYKELTEDKNGYTKTQVRRSWELYLSVQPLIGFFLEGRLSLLMILGTIFTPAVGKAVDFAAGKLGVSVDGFISVSGNLPITVSIGKDQYENWSVAGSRVALELTFKIGVRAVYEGRAGHLQVEVAGVMENTLEVNNFREPDQKKEGWFQCDFLGFIQLGAYATYSADLFNWNWASRKTIGVKQSGSAEWKPKELKFPRSARGPNPKPFWQPIFNP